MNTGNHIHYLRRQEIQDAKWDHCLDNARNGLIYGRTFYLDHMTDGQWDALVLDDYKAVMPLTWKRKWGIRYLFQPPFTQQLGIFSDTEIPSSLVGTFLAGINKYFRFAEIFLNYGNPHPSLTPHADFTLNLDRPYPQLAANYKKGLVGSLRTAARLPLHYSADLDLSFSLRLNRDKYKDRIPHVGPASYDRFETLCLSLQARGQAMVRAMMGEDRQPLATALLLEEKGRLYLLQATTLPEGRRIGANHLLLDSVIREFSGQHHILDFEGSDIPGIAHFYKSFGGVDQPYFFYLHNQLPWPIKLFK